MDKYVVNDNEVIVEVQEEIGDLFILHNVIDVKQKLVFLVNGKRDDLGIYKTLIQAFSTFKTKENFIVLLILPVVLKKRVKQCLETYDMESNVLLLDGDVKFSDVNFNQTISVPDFIESGCIFLRHKRIVEESLDVIKDNLEQEFEEKKYEK